jgi:hypothetical protein
MSCIICRALRSEAEARLVNLSTSGPIPKPYSSTPTCSLLMRRVCFCARGRIIAVGTGDDGPDTPPLHRPRRLRVLRPLISAATRLTRKFFRLTRCVLLSLVSSRRRRPSSSPPRNSRPFPRRRQTHSPALPSCAARAVSLLSRPRVSRPLSPHTLDTVLPPPSMRRAAVPATPAHAVVLHPARHDLRLRHTRLKSTTRMPRPPASPIRRAPPRVCSAAASHRQRRRRRRRLSADRDQLQ